MTFYTFNLGMLFFQDISGFVMIKFLDLPSHEVEIEALMIRMAGYTNSLKVSVQSFIFINSLSNFFMTGKAVFISDTASQGMTLGAVG
jgi:hypothetical protein